MNDRFTPGPAIERLRLINAEMYEALKDALSFLEIALKTSVVHKSTGKGGHDGEGNSWSECAGIPEWRARQMVDEWTAALAKAEQEDQETSR